MVDGGRRLQLRARVLSLFDVVAMAALLLLIFVVPAYTTAGETLSGQTGRVTTSSGSTTIIEANPQALTVVMVIVALSFASLVFTLLTAWLDSTRVRWVLMILLIPLTGLATLAVFSIGIFMAPLVIIGWVVFAIRKRHVASETPNQVWAPAAPGDSN